MKSLRLRSVGVQFIEAHALDDFVALTELDLSDNQLVMPNPFARLVKALPLPLKVLKLSGNDLTNVTQIIGMHSQPKLPKKSTTKNPFWVLKVT